MKLVLNLYLNDMQSRKGSYVSLIFSFSILVIILAKIISNFPIMAPILDAIL